MSVTDNGPLQHINSNPGRPSSQALEATQSQCSYQTCQGLSEKSVSVLSQEQSAGLQASKKLLLLYVFEEPGASTATPQYLSAVSVRCLDILITSSC